VGGVALGRELMNLCYWTTLWEEEQPRFKKLIVITVNTPKQGRYCQAHFVLLRQTSL